MIEQTFGPRRCRDSKKPPSDQCPGVSFYRCENCGSLFLITGDNTHSEKEIFCCGIKTVHLIPDSPDLVKDKITLDYKITGGYNDNAVKVYWEAKKTEYIPEWIYLKTFTGGYLKYVSKAKRPPLVFSLADTDAFAYCDEDPCLECVFRCKRGFVIYSYSRETGLTYVPLDKMTAQWQSGANKNS